MLVVLVRQTDCSLDEANERLRMVTLYTSQHILQLTYSQLRKFQHSIIILDTFHRLADDLAITYKEKQSAFFLFVPILCIYRNIPSLIQIWYYLLETILKFKIFIFRKNVLFLT